MHVCNGGEFGSYQCSQQTKANLPSQDAGTLASNYLHRLVVGSSSARWPLLLYDGFETEMMCVSVFQGQDWEQLDQAEY